MAQHEKAVPIKLALKEHYSVITPKEVQFCYQNNLIHKNENKLFECITLDCTAPLTCQNMTHKNRTAFFVEGKRSSNLHISSCPFSEENLKTTGSVKQQEQKSIYESSGLTVLDTPGGRFQNTIVSSTNLKTDSNQEDDKPMNSSAKRTYSDPKTKDTLPHKPRNNHISAIGDLVTQYEENRNFIIHKGFIGENVPIYRYFRQIKYNHIPSLLHDHIPVYYGSGRVYLSKKGYYTFYFNQAVPMPNGYFRPHFFVEKEFTDLNFPFMGEYAKQKYTLNLYISSRFWFNELKPNEYVLRFQERGKELLPFIYFTERK